MARTRVLPAVEFITELGLARPDGTITPLTGFQKASDYVKILYYLDEVGRAGMDRFAMVNHLDFGEKLLKAKLRHLIKNGYVENNTEGQLFRSDVYAITRKGRDAAKMLRAYHELLRPR